MKVASQLIFRQMRKSHCTRLQSTEFLLLCTRFFHIWEFKPIHVANQTTLLPAGATYRLLMNWSFVFCVIIFFLLAKYLLFYLNCDHNCLLALQCTFRIKASASICICHTTAFTSLFTCTHTVSAEASLTQQHISITSLLGFRLLNSLSSSFLPLLRPFTARWAGTPPEKKTLCQMKPSASPPLINPLHWASFSLQEPPTTYRRQRALAVLSTERDFDLMPVKFEDYWMKEQIIFNSRLIVKSDSQCVFGMLHCQRRLSYDFSIRAKCSLG